MLISTASVRPPASGRMAPVSTFTAASATAPMGQQIESPSAAEWWVDGRLHRPDGPAVEGSEGRVVGRRSPPPNRRPGGRRARRA